jgi:spermidine/putrescine transport system substrate-binding protein
LTIVFLLITALSLSACSAQPAPAARDDDIMEQARQEGMKLHIYDWAEWWPEEIYQGFSQEYGIEIVRDNFADLDEMLTKFKLQPNIGYDLTLADPRTLIQMKELGLLQGVNMDWLPNVDLHLMEDVRSTDFNPNCTWGVPTELYFVGYAYNTSHVEENDPRLGSWAMLFEGQEYSGKITMLDDMFNTIGCALKYLGYSYNSDDENELAEAKEVLLRQKPWVVAYDSWPKRLVLEGEAAISHSWVGEAWFYYQELDTIRGVLPREGTEMGSDYLVIPKSAPHPAAAHLFIDYIFRPEVNALLIETIGYAPVHKQVAAMLPEDMKAWPGMDPPSEILERSEFVSPKAFTGKGLELRTKIWEELKR